MRDTILPRTHLRVAVGNGCALVPGAAAGGAIVAVAVTLAEHETATKGGKVEGGAVFRHYAINNLLVGAGKLVVTCGIFCHHYGSTPTKHEQCSIFLPVKWFACTYGLEVPRLSSQASVKIATVKYQKKHGEGTNARRRW